MRRKKVWLINPFDFLPNSGFPMMRYESFAKAFIEAGWEVVWFTSDFDHILRQYRVESKIDYIIPYSGLRIEFAHLPSYKKTFDLSRIWNHILYVKYTKKRMHELQNEMPNVILVSLPLLGTVKKALEQKKQIKCKVVADVQDLWPEAIRNALPLQLQKVYNPLCFLMVKYERHLIKRCDGVIAVSETYLRKRGTKNIPYLKAYLGVDITSFDQARKNSKKNSNSPFPLKSNNMKFIWAGSIRAGVDLKTVLKAAKIVRERGINVNFIIAGDGPGKKMFKKLSEKLGLNDNNVLFIGKYNATELPKIMRHCHVGLNVYPKGCSNSVTNKLFEYQAGGLAIINSISGEVADIIERCGMGINYRASVPKSLANAITEFALEPKKVATMGRAARNFTNNYGSRIEIAKNVVNFCENL